MMDVSYLDGQHCLTVTSMGGHKENFYYKTKEDREKDLKILWDNRVK